MIKLLELTKRQTLVLSAVATGLGIAMVLALGVFVAAQSNTAKQAFGAQPVSSFDKPASVTEQPVVETQRDEDGTVTPTGGTQTVTKYDAPQAATTQPAPKTQNSKPLQPTPATDPLGATVEGVTDTVRGVTYTVKNVIPGDPLSYIGTYGQCPFYEDAGVKGCWPPSNLTCNADWSYCAPKN